MNINNPADIAILGGGPSGLMAAWACIDAGFRPTVFEKNPRKPSIETAGVFYLHQRCNLPVRSADVHVIPTGALPGRLQGAYRHKVYGPDSSVQPNQVSIPASHEIAKVYDGMQALEFIWRIAENFIVQREFRDGMEALNMALEFPAGVINTIPLPVLFPDRSFPGRKAWIKTASLPYPIEESADNAYVVYNANPFIPWYRLSNIFGRWTMEFRPGYIPYQADSAWPYTCREVIKVETFNRTNLPDLPKNFLLTGRYGAWDKSCLTHHVYRRVQDWLCQGR